MEEKSIVICGHGSGKPSTKNLYAYLESRYNSFANNGKRKGLVCVRRYKGLTANDRMKFHETYGIIIGRNTYNQNLRQYVYQTYKDGKWYSDCSSSGCATYKAIGKTCSLLNTAGIYSSDLFETVPVEIKKGHIKNPELLQVGDALLFAGNDPSRPLQIGHVEYIYELPTVNEIQDITVEGEQTIEADTLNIRSDPSSSSSKNIVGTYAKGEVVKIIAKAGNWFKTDKGYISRNHTKGWIKEYNSSLNRDDWWYNNMGTYPMNVVVTIDGADYAFDRAGWCLTSDRLSASCAIIY